MAGHHDFALLTHVKRFETVPGFFISALMASSDVDQKFLGRFAKETEDRNPFLASMLFRILGLSVLLSKKLLRARRLRRLDTTRDTKSLQLYHHIIWLSREGLVITQQYILPMAEGYVELKVLASKLQASFYHIFVLFHNQPSINQASIPSYTKAGTKPVIPDPLQGGPVQQSSLPPGLTPISIPKPAGSFLLPAVDYIPTASACFAQAATLAEDLLTGSHPIRASIKVEYAAFLYDCLHDGDGSRKLAQVSLRDVYTDTAGMDDDMFEETAKLVVILDKMSKRGISSQASSTRGGSATPSTPGIPLATGAHPSVPSPAVMSPEARSPAARGLGVGTPSARSPAARSPAARSPAARSPAPKSPAAKSPTPRSPESRRTAEKSSGVRESAERSPDTKRSAGRSPEARRPIGGSSEAKRSSGKSPETKRPAAKSSPGQSPPTPPPKSPSQNRAVHRRSPKR